MKKWILLSVIFTFNLYSNAQWTLQPGIGMSIPITGYSTIVKTGTLLQFDAAKRLKNPRWGIGLMLGWARMHHDDNEADFLRDARLDQIPIVATIDHQFKGEKIAPYAAMGIGVSLYNLNYVPPASAGETVFNASFSLMPRLGLRKIMNKYAPFIEVNCPLVMDGPPIGVSQGEKVTGYVGIAVGVAYYL